MLAVGAGMLFLRIPNGPVRAFLIFFALQAVAYLWLSATEAALLGGASVIAERQVRALVFRGLSLLSYGQLLWALRR